MEEIKQGYKQTDIGLIPEDWKIKPLSSLTEKIMVGIASSATYAYRQSGVKMFRNQNIKPNFLDDADIIYLDPNYEALFKNKRLKSGDLLTARTGYPGTTCKVPPKHHGSQSFTTLISRLKHELISVDYLCYYINSEFGQSFFDQNKIGGGQQNVNASTLKNMPIPYPEDKSEQTAIATALSDTDALIAALEKKIVKKQQIKQGAMQQLLTGKKRLQGFSRENEYKETEIGLIPEDWEIIKVEEAFRFLSTASFSRDQLGSEGNVQCLHYGDIHTKYDEFIDFTFVELPKVIGKRGLSYPLLQDGDIIMADASEDYTGLCKSVEIKNVGNKKAISGLHTILLRERNNVFENGFKGYIFKINEVRKQLIELSTGMKVFGVSKKNLEQVFIPVPTKPEQTAIAQILTDMDNEIAQLEKERDKYVRLKSGMMQVLLTGKVRLISNQN